MKQQYQSKQNSQNEKFNRQLNHLQGVVGLANWNFSRPSNEELKAYENKAHLIRATESARITRGVIKRIAHGIKVVSARVVSETKRRYLRRKSIDKLLQLDDYMLKDIGISRGDVMALASGKVTSDEINAQRLGRRAVLKQGVAKPVQQPVRKDTQRFSANDPHHLRECA